MDSHLEDDEPSPKRHSFLQEEARMLSPIFQAADEVGAEWRELAACSRTVRAYPEAMDHWFAPDGTFEAATATMTCFAMCPVRLECLRWASVSKQKHGIWGGIPESLRIPSTAKDGRYGPHSYGDLSELDNPYHTDDPRSRFHYGRVTFWEGEEDV